MAFKALLALGLTIAVMMKQSHQVNGEEMNPTSERWGDDYNKPEENHQRMMNMKGTPMMCYNKRKVMASGNKTDDGKANGLLEQSAQLLTMVLERIRSGEDLDVEFIQQATAALQNMATTGDKVDMQQNTTLGLELAAIIDRLLRSGQTVGVSVSESGEMSDLTPMNDDPVPTPPRIPLPAGFDLQSLGLSVAELLNLIQDPTMTFMFEGLGFGPFLEALRDERVFQALSQLDIASINELLLSGDILTPDNQVNMEAIQRYLDRLEGDGGAVTMNMTTTATARPQLEDNPLLMTFSSMMSLLGIENELTPDNLIPTFLEAVRLIGTTNDTLVDALIGILSEITEEDLQMYGMLNGVKSLEEMRESDNELMLIFDTIMMFAGIEGNITENNLMEALIIGLRFIVTADESILPTIWEMIEDLDLFPTTEGTGTQTGGESMVVESSTMTTTTRMPTAMPSVETKPPVTTTSMAMKTTMAMSGGVTMGTSDLMVSFQQLMQMAGVEGEVTEGNLLESVITAMQYILSADQDTLTAFIQILEGMNLQNSSSSGSISLGGMQGNVRAIFNRIMALAGVGEVTDENLMESVIKAITFLLAADEETIADIVRLMGEFGTTTGIGGQGGTTGMRRGVAEEGGQDGETTGTSGGATQTGVQGDGETSSTATTSTTTTTRVMTSTMTMPTTRSTTAAARTTHTTRAPPVTGNERGVVDVFRRILLLTGNTGDITEDNVVEKTLAAMQFILQADQDTLALILEEFNKIILPEVTATPMEDKKEMKTDGMKDRYEMVCYPMSEADMKKYMQDNKVRSGSKGNGTMTMGHSTDKETKNMTGDHQRGMMDKTMCASCKSEEELMEMMKKMVKDEVSRVFADVVTNMGGVTSISSEVQVVLSKMANGMLRPETKVPSEPTSTTPVTQKDESSVITKWEEWSSFGTCTRSCGGGQQTRSRVCTVVYRAQNPGDNCEERETSDCNQQPCSVEWADWENWLPCSASCGQGTSTRRRECVERIEGESCEKVETRSCSNRACPSTTTSTAVPTDFWKEWEQWSPCSLTCGMGVVSRRRTCNRPTQTSNCVQFETQNCMVRTCPITSTTRSTTTRAPTAPVYSNWSEWGGCSRSCGGGLRRRTRTCLSGSCNGRFEQIVPCNNVPCSTVTAGPRISNPTVVPTITHRSTRIPSTSRSILSPPIVGGTCPPSPYRTLSYGGKCIVFHGRQSGMKTFVEYRQYCQGRGGDIVRTENVEKWVQIAYWMSTITSQSYRQARSELTWIGATDAGDRGRWSHPADRLMSEKRNFMIWKRGEPKAVGYDQCAILNVSSGHATSARCSERRYAICEY